MNIVILDDYQDAVRKLPCAARLEPFNAKVYTNTVKGIGQLAVRLRDVEVLVLIRERTQFPRALLEKLPKLKLISQTGKVGPHIDVDTCTRLGIAVAEGVGAPFAAAELTWALIMAAMRRLPQYIGNLKHGAWQQSGLKTASMPPNFGIGQVLRGRRLGVWGYGKIGQLVAGYGRAFGMQVVVWGSEASRARAVADGHQAAASCQQFFAETDVLSVHLRLNDVTRGLIKLEDLALMKPTALFVNTSRAELVEDNALVSALNKGRPGLAPPASYPATAPITFRHAASTSGPAPANTFSSISICVPDSSASSAAPASLSSSCLTRRSCAAGSDRMMVFALPYASMPSAPGAGASPFA